MERDPLQWLYGLQKFGIKLGLEGIRTLLDRLGHPERTYPSVLIGGTNGKGSVAAMVDSVLSASGLATGLYTSPHLVRPNERIRIRGEDIASPDLDRCLLAVRREAERAVADGDLEAHPSFFEVMTAAALLAFRDARIDAAILEVGLGGRLDATNAVEARLAAIVTVDLDHTDRLGQTLAEIAAEKAGIVKAGRPLVSGVVQPEAVSVLRRTCEVRRAPFVDARARASLRAGAGGRYTVETEAAAYPDLVIPLPGRHQIENARVAVVLLEEAARDLGVTLDPSRAREGLARVRWAGRLQWVAGDPPLLLDGAHNPAGAEMLAAYLREQGGPPPVLLFGAMSGKDAAGMLSSLAGLTRHVILTRPPLDRATPPGDLEAAAAAAPRVETVPDPATALDRARSAARGRGFVLVAGSLYLVGAVLALLEGADGAPGPVPM